MVAAVEELVGSRPVSMLVENLDPADVAAARREKPPLRDRLGGLSSEQIVTIFGAIDALIVAGILRLYGFDDLVGGVSDVFGWPMAIIGLSAFLMSLGQRRED